MTDAYAALRSNVAFLGTILGDTFREAHGQEFFDKIEGIRRLSKSSSSDGAGDNHALIACLSDLSSEELLPVARAFSQFLNLVNIAEQYHTTSRYREADVGVTGVFDGLLEKLHNAEIPIDQFEEALDHLKMELVLTAHPTEVTRRTLIHKYVQINECLNQLELKDLAVTERIRLENRLRQLIAQAWHTEEIRKTRPTPVDEAKWGFAVIEESLWLAVPRFLKRLDNALLKELGRRVPVDASLVQITSWMGGDRDGNPFVTSTVTEEVLLLSRRKAMDLYINDIDQLFEELSMAVCNDRVRQMAGETHEPYREVLRALRARVEKTEQYLLDRLDGLHPEVEDLIEQDEDLWQPLHACYESLHECGMGIIADGILLDVLRRIRCFGVNLLRLDIRQDSARHTQFFSELTQYLEIGDYEEWDETRRQDFLIAELNNKRPLLSPGWRPSDDVQEVLDTARVIARTPREALGVYVISMARAPSDVLAVCLLLKEAGCPYYLDVAPLFETLDDLDGGGEAIKQLLAIDWYKNQIKGSQTVMIGYSDSAKDAGVLAAGWAQYRAQEALVKLCEEQNTELVLFHGRGGTIGRGGAPAGAALLSQPPGSLKSGLRVTEQGEMIRFKFGLPDVAVNSLVLYAETILQANLLPPPEPKAHWRETMDKLSERSCAAYRAVVRDTPEFVEYFRAATPEQELSMLPLGSRPAKRRAGGIESLRAIPWIFAWMQNRLMLPAWLGAGEALGELISDGQQSELEAMCDEWPFFSTRISMLEMVYMKSDAAIAQHYDQVLVDESLWPLGQKLRDQLASDIKAVLAIANENQLMDDEPWIKESISQRKIYTDPLNLLQVELLRRSRSGESDEVEMALMVTIAGIAAGMRNTG